MSKDNKKKQYAVQNYFANLIMLVFSRTNPDEAEANRFGPQIDALIQAMLGDKEIYDHVERAKNIFTINEDGTLELGRTGQALAILKSRVMQRDMYAAYPLDYLYANGRQGVDKRPFFSNEEGRQPTKVDVYRDIVVEIGNILTGGQLTAEEITGFVEAHNIATESLEKGIKAIQGE